MPPRKKIDKKNVKSMFINLNSVIDQVGKDKGIPKQVLIEVVENAMLTAAARKLGYHVDLEAHYNEEAGEIELFHFKTVIEGDDIDEEIEIEMSQARKLDPECQVGDSIGQKIDSAQFGRIAAQTAKQVIITKMRDAERDIISEEYKDRLGEIITGIVRRYEKGNIIIDLGRTEAILYPSEQVPGEVYRNNDRVQALFLKLDVDAKGPMIVLSRKSPNFVKALFEMEIPEIGEGIVEVKAVARELGSRAKIAVYSNDGDVDPVGACVGIKGSRVKGVVQELHGEQVDVIPWDEDPAKFVCNAITPAQVSKVVVHNDSHTMEIIVPDDQLSLAIGKRGQNVRLAAQLTGWSIDILSEAKYDKQVKNAKEKLMRFLDLDSAMASILYSHSFKTPDIIAKTPKEVFMQLPGLGQQALGTIHDSATNLVADVRSYRELKAKLDAEIEEKEAAAAHAAANIISGPLVETPALPVETEPASETTEPAQ